VVQCGAVCCSVLQSVAVWCSLLQCVAMWCSVWQCVAMRCSVLQCVAEDKYLAFKAAAKSSQRVCVHDVLLPTWFVSLKLLAFLILLMHITRIRSERVCFEEVIILT